jgi:hypothetical protein
VVVNSRIIFSWLSSSFQDFAARTGFRIGYQLELLISLDWHALVIRVSFMVVSALLGSRSQSLWISDIFFCYINFYYADSEQQL